MNLIHRERGAVLLLGLLLLSLLGLIVSNAWSQTIWQQRIAHHERDRARAEAAARSALAWAEDWLMSLPGDRWPAACSSNCADQAIIATGGLPGDIATREELWWLDNAQADGFDPISGRQLALRQGSSTPAGRWLIEEIHFEAAGTRAPGAPATSYYRIIARAARVPLGTPVVLETILARPWGDIRWTSALPSANPHFCHNTVDSFEHHCGRMRWRRLQ